MRCLMCGKYFFIKKSFINLFSEEKLFICNTCKTNNMLEVEFQEIPLENHMLRIVSTMKFKKGTNNLAYINEMSEIRNKLISIRRNDFEIISTDFYLSENKLNEIEMLAKMMDKDILILTNSYKL